VLGGLWFVNLVNFMDGLDLMTVAEAMPLTAALVILGQTGALPAYGTIVALALDGAVLGFAYFNRPVAKLFLGDVGSLPIGLLLGWLLLMLATGGHLTAAIVLPLYYLADATLTLLRRLIRGERLWLAHRTHFYQLATDRGFTVTQVVALVFAVSVGLCALAIMTAIAPGSSATSRRSLAAPLLWPDFFLLLPAARNSARADRNPARSANSSAFLSSGRALEIRHRVAQHAVDGLALLKALDPKQAIGEADSCTAT
jgi:Glycosyl transferase family 4